MESQDLSVFVTHLNQLVNMCQSTDQETRERSVLELNEIIHNDTNFILIVQALIWANSNIQWIGTLSRYVCKYVRLKLYSEDPNIKYFGKLILESIKKQSFFTVLVPNIEGAIIDIFRFYHYPVIFKQYFSQALKFYATKNHKYLLDLLKILILSSDISVSIPYIAILNNYLTKTPATIQKMALTMVNNVLDNYNNIKNIYPISPVIFQFIEDFNQEGVKEEFIEHLIIVLQIASKIVFSAADYETKTETKEIATNLAGDVISKCMELYEAFEETSQIILNGLIFAYNAVGPLGTQIFIDKDFYSFLFTLISVTSKEYTDEEPFQVFTDLYDVSYLIEPGETDFRSVCLAYLQSMASFSNITDIIQALPDIEDATAEPYMFFIFMLSEQIRKLEDCDEKRSVKEAIAAFAEADFSEEPIATMTQCLLLSSQTDDMTEEMFEDVKSKLREIATCDTDDLAGSVFKYVAVKSSAESTHHGFPIFTDEETVELIRNEEDMNMSPLLFEILHWLIENSALTVPADVFQLIIEIGNTLLDEFISREQIKASILRDESNEADSDDDSSNSMSNVDIIEIIASFIVHYPEHIDYELFFEFFERILSDDNKGSTYHCDFRKIISSLFTIADAAILPQLYDVFERYINTLNQPIDVLLLIRDILIRNNSAFADENERLIQIICASSLDGEADFIDCAALLAVMIQLQRDSDELIQSFYEALGSITHEFTVMLCCSIISASMIIVGKDPGERIDMIVRLIESPYQIRSFDLELIRRALQKMAEQDEQAQTVLQELESREGDTFPGITESEYENTVNYPCLQ